MQEVIVYRSPAEAALWHSISEHSDVVFPVMMAVVAFFITMLCINSLVRKTGRRLVRNKSVFSVYQTCDYITGVIAMFAAVMTFKYFFI